MQTFQLRSFKAFENTLDLPLAGSNAIFYGDNGAGKSSIFEALRLAFYADKVKQRVVEGVILQADKDSKWQDYLDKLKNRPNHNDFEIKLNGVDYDQQTTAEREVFDVFMISNKDINIGSSISVQELLQKAYFPNNSETFLNDPDDLIIFVDNINKALKVNFKESISIEVSVQNSYKCKIKDDVRNIESIEGVSVLFNEAKLHLITLLCFFSAIQLYPVIRDHRRILILDDIITSLDAANRTFLLKYLCDNFGPLYQKLFFTHNISYFNLWMHAINNIYKVEKSRWMFFNVMECKDEHRAYNNADNTDSIKKLKEDLANATSNNDLTGVGNRVRKRFEQDVHELSKLLLIGNKDESSIILDRLLGSDKKLYLIPSEHGIKTVYDLVDDIDKLANNQYKSKSDIQAKINEYDHENELQKIIPYIEELRLYQKVSMHPSSHGAAGQPFVNKQEVSASIELLEILESKLNKLIDSNVYTI